MRRTFDDLSRMVAGQLAETPTERAPVPPRQKRDFLARRRWSDDLLPIGRLAKRAAIFRRLSMDGVFERQLQMELPDYPPAFRRQLEDIVANVGDLIAKLSCEVDARPSPSFEWLKDGTRLPMDDAKYARRYSDGVAELHVRRVDASDAADYTCCASNLLGAVQTTARLTDVQHGPPEFLHQLADTTVRLGELFKLCVTCTVLPEPEVTWFKNGAPVDLNDYKYRRCHDKGRYELEICCVDVRDECEWRCVGVSAFGRCESSCRLSVAVPDDCRRPVFDTPLRPAGAVEGDTVRLEVIVDAHPPPDIVWSKDGKELGHGQHVRLVFDDERRVYSLVLMDAFTEDSGVYRCVATNAVGVAESDCRVHVQPAADARTVPADPAKAPRFRLPLKSRSLPVGFGVSLVCCVTGAPPPTVVWLKDGQPLLACAADTAVRADRVTGAGCHTTFQYENGVCQLNMERVQSTDEGEYTCVAENCNGDARTTCVLTVTGEAKAEAILPQFKEALMDLSAVEGSEIILECRVTGRPAPSINWYKDGLKVCMENRMLAYTDRKGVCRLNIMDVTLDDAGQYSCQARNVAGKQLTHCTVRIAQAATATGRRARRLSTPTSGASAERLSPSSVSVTRPPFVVRPLADTVVTAGRRVVLACEVGGYPTPTVEWKKDGQLLQESRHQRLYFDGATATMKIYESHADHEGVYVCRASSASGAVETRARLTVESSTDEMEAARGEPRFLSKLTDETVDEGASATLSCVLAGEPRPAVSWFHDGGPLGADDGQPRAFDDGAHSLHIECVRREHAGVYTARADNSMGSVECSAFLSVTHDSSKDAEVSTVALMEDGAATAKREARGRAPSAPSTAECSSVGSGSLRLRWAPPTDAGDSTVEAYRIEQRSADSEEWTEIGLADVAEFDVRQLTSDTEYSFRVTARNSAAWGAPSAASPPVRTLADARPPRFTLRLDADDVRLDEGAQLTLQVAVDGLPEPTVRWFKDGAQVHESERLSVIFLAAGKCKLVLRQCLPTDSGQYSCHAENEAGLDVQSTFVTVVSLLADSIQSVPPPSPSLDTKMATAVEKAPEVLVGLTDQSVRCGQTIVLTCRIPSAPRGKVRWFRGSERLRYVECSPSRRLEGRRLSARDRVELLASKHGAYRLVLHDSRPSDSDTYRVVVENPSGAARSECRVAVVDAADDAPPAFEEPLRDRTVAVGTELTLRCRLAGRPQPQVVWTKDGQRLQSTRRLQLGFDEDGSCALTIGAAAVADSGVYLCSATNGVGTESTSALVTVLDERAAARLPVAAKRASDRRAAEFVRAPPERLDVAAGARLELQAEATGLPPPSYTWLKDGKVIAESSRIFANGVSASGVAYLRVLNITKKSSGTFSCIAENSEGKDSIFVRLSVKDESDVSAEALAALRAGEAPRFVRDVADVTAAEGAAATFDCLLSGSPQPSVSWQRDDGGALSAAWLESQLGRKCGLRCERVTAADAGTVHCVAANAHGRVCSAALLSVGGPQTPSSPAQPHFVRCLNDIWSGHGETVRFVCQVDGNPEPDVAWFKDGELVVESANVRVSERAGGRRDSTALQVSFGGDGACWLELANVAPSSLGTYSCTATNEHGAVTSSGALRLGRPRDARPPVFLQGLSDRTVLIGGRATLGVLVRDDKTLTLKHVYEEKVVVEADSAPDAPPDALAIAAAAAVAADEQAAGEARAEAPPEQAEATTEALRKLSGQAPAFERGLHDMDLKEGECAAVAGKSAKRKKRHHRGHAEGATEHAAAATPETPVHSTTVEEIQRAVRKRNASVCAPRFIVKPRPKKQITEGKSLRLKTAISANPTAQVAWDKSGMILETGNKYSIYNDGDFYYLEVHHVSESDAGFYNCVATNAHGMAAASAELDVAAAATERHRSRKQPTAPQFIEVLPGKLEALEGSPLALECSVAAWPAAAVCWLHERRPLLPGAGVSMSYDGECATLRFDQLDARAAGRYTCLASNASGEARTALRLLVRSAAAADDDDDDAASGEPPAFAPVEQAERVATDGERVTLVAALTQGTEPVDVSWSHENCELADSAGFRYGRVDARCSLLIADAFPEDSGRYVCTASNKYGCSQIECSLVVQSRADAAEVAQGYSGTTAARTRRR